MVVGKFLRNTIKQQIIDCKKCSSIGIDYSYERTENLSYAYQYIPENVNTLWIVESPPFSDPPRYFYRPELTGNDSLFREVMKSLNIIPSSPKNESLNEFKKLGYFLIDAAKCPVDKGNSHLKPLMIKNCSSILQQEVISLQPNKIVIIKSNLYHTVQQSLKEIDFNTRIINFKPIPFPGSGQQRRFREAISELLFKDKPMPNLNIP